MTAGDVMDLAASLLNDAAKTLFTYTIQIPYLNMAINEMEETIQQNNLPVSNRVSSPITITAGTVDVGGSGPALPSGLLEVQGIMERAASSSDAYEVMTRQEFLSYQTVVGTKLNIWTWQNQKILFIGASTNREIRINFLSSVLSAVTASSDTITLFNCKTFLAYRTAGLAAQFVGENKTRADELNMFAAMALDRFIDINSKGIKDFVKQKPFMDMFRTKKESRIDLGS